MAHLCRPDTIAALDRRYAMTGSLVKLCRSLGLPESMKGTISGIFKNIPGQCSLDCENIIRVKLGLEPINLKEIPACPDCGEFHYLLRCNGKKGELKIIAPDGVNNGNRLRRQHITIRESVFREVNTARLLAGMEWEEFLLDLVRARSSSPLNVAPQTQIQQEPDLG